MCEAIRQIREEGRNEGRNEGRHELICMLIRSGMSATEIATRIQLPLEQVAAIEKKMV